MHQTAELTFSEALKREHSLCLLSVSVRHPSTQQTALTQCTMCTDRPHCPCGWQNLATDK